MANAIDMGSVAGTGIAGLTDWKTILDASPFSTLIFTPDLTLLHCNAAHSRNSGVSSGDLAGRYIFDVFPKNPDGTGPDTEKIIRTSVAKVIETLGTDEPPIQRHDLPREGGGFEPRFWRIMHSPIVQDGEVVAIRQDSWDVTASALEAERQETLKRVAGSMAGIAFWELDVGRDRIVHNPEFDLLFGFPADDGTDHDRPFSTYTDSVHEDDRENFETTIAGLLDDGIGSVREFQTRIVRPSGEVRHVLMRCEVSADAWARALLTGITFDVTELHRNEQRLADLLSEKEALLGEMNHRVKNSLQLVSAILSLEARKAEEGEATRLRSAARRVQSVAAVHAALYHGKDVDTVEMGAHLRDFCAHLAESLGTEQRGIGLVVDADDTRLPASETISLALIVNELVTNAFKHAFPEEAPPDAEVAVTFRRLSGDRFRLTVADNGKSDGTESPSAGSMQEPGVSAIAGTGLGMQLIATIARQLDADVRQEQNDGWSTSIEFGQST